jgi:hypothetical protein
VGAGSRVTDWGIGKDEETSLFVGEAKILSPGEETIGDAKILRPGEETSPIGEVKILRPGEETSSIEEAKISNPGEERSTIEEADVCCAYGEVATEDSRALVFNGDARGSSKE